MKAILVKWVDAAHVGGWRSLKAAQEFIDNELNAVESVGMLMHEDEEKIVLIQTHGQNEVMGLFEIPKGCIKSITWLELSEL